MTITNDIKYIGVNDHQVDLFEGQYVVPNGMAYNSYAILDEKIAIMDSVDYSRKLADIFGNNDIRSISVVRMQVPCCGGLPFAVRQALLASGKEIPVNVVTVSPQGYILKREQ